MNMRRGLLGVLVVGVALAGAGCISTSGHWGVGVWTDNTTQRLAVDTTNLKKIEVDSHNGFVHFTGTTGEAFVVVTKKARGSSAGDAQSAMNALVVFVEPDGAGVQRIGYRWRGIKRPSWGASVSFDIHAPSEIDLIGTTHNGQVNVSGLAGDLAIKTHNGAIKAETTGTKLSAISHNGGIQVKCAARELNLEAHNGSVTADLTACGTVGGRIATHNGGVEITVSDTTSMDFDAATGNGGIRCTAPIQTIEVTKRTLTGTVGEGGERLAVRTHNGSVRVLE